MTAFWLAHKFDDHYYCVTCDVITMQSMEFLRKTPVEDKHSFLDRERIRRMKCPVNLEKQMKNYEFEVLATTGFFFPADFKKLVGETAAKFNG